MRWEARNYLALKYRPVSYHSGAKVSKVIVPFADRPRPIQIVFVCISPLLYGALVGIAVGISAMDYWVLSIIGGITAFLAGLEHPTPGPAVPRGAATGAVYGVGVLAAHAIAGTHATVALNGFPLTIVVTGIAGGILTGLGSVMLQRLVAQPST